jgi:hypothetical protein
MRSAKEKARDIKLADMVVRATNRYFKREMKKLEIRWEPRDSEMIRMVRQDRKDLIHFSSLVRRGHYIEALRVMEDLDTVPREEIPVSVYNNVQKWG